MLVAGWFEASLGLNAEIEDLGSTYPSSFLSQEGDCVVQLQGQPY